MYVGHDGRDDKFEDDELIEDDDADDNIEISFNMMD